MVVQRLLLLLKEVRISDRMIIYVNQNDILGLLARTLIIVQNPILLCSHKMLCVSVTKYLLHRVYLGVELRHRIAAELPMANG